MVAKNLRTSSTNNCGCSNAAKWPPRGIFVQWVTLYVASHQWRGALKISFGNAAMPVGSSTRPKSPKKVKLSQYIRADDAADAVTQYIITLSTSSSLVSTFSGWPSQSIHDQNFSTIQASWPAGESTRPYPRVWGRVDCCFE